MLIITTKQDIETWADGLTGPDQTDEQTGAIVDLVMDARIADADSPDWGADWQDWLERLDIMPACEPAAD